MEPNLNDMDDYDKPLSPSKKRIIVLFFAGLIVLYSIYALVLSSL